MTRRARVPAGAYLDAAVALTERDGEFDAYSLVAEVERRLGLEELSVGYTAGGAWIRRAYRCNGSVVRRLSLGDGGGRGAEPARYGVVEVELRRRRRRRP